MFNRLASDLIQRHRRGYPVIAITGPRQAGKSVLARQGAPDLPFINLEDPIERVRWHDLQGMLGHYADGAIIDEAQHLPDLFPALQAWVDAHPRSRWILTGSNNPVMTRHIAQSLAGRAAYLELLPFSLAELATSPRRPATLVEAVFRGGYAPLYDPDRDLEPVGWLSNHLSAIIGKDIPDLLEVRDRTTFVRFMGMCAALTGREMNQSEIAAALGISSKTVEAWLSVLEATCLVVRLHPHHRNFGKRLVKRPKLYFLDSGLACRLLHITQVEQLWSHPLWGHLVETWCVGEILKSLRNRGRLDPLWFWRSSDGHEVDLILETGAGLLPIEIKANVSPHPDLAKGLVKFHAIVNHAERLLPGAVIYGGDNAGPLGPAQGIPWHAIDAFGAGIP